MRVEDRQPHSSGRVSAIASKARSNLLPITAGAGGGATGPCLLTEPSLAPCTRGGDPCPAPSRGSLRGPGQQAGPQTPSRVQGQEGLGWSGAHNCRGAPHHPPSCQKPSQQQRL